MKIMSCNECHALNVIRWMLCNVFNVMVLCKNYILHWILCTLCYAMAITQTISCNVCHAICIMCWMSNNGMRWMSCKLYYALIIMYQVSCKLYIAFNIMLNLLIIWNLVWTFLKYSCLLLNPEWLMYIHLWTCNCKFCHNIYW